MNLRALRVATFKHATLASLHGFVNDFLSGAAVAAVDSGTVAYAAGEVAERSLIDQWFDYDGTSYVIVLFYTDG